MESIQLFLNDRLVSITAKSTLIQQLKTDDTYLSEYITNAVKSNQFTFLNESDLNKLTVKRAIFTKAEPSLIPPLATINKATKTPTMTTATVAGAATITTSAESPPPLDLIQVWCRKGKPSDDDLNATALLLQLRASEEYVQRFNDKKSVRLKLWEEIANEIREAGYDVDATKCQQKFLNMTKTHVKFLKRQLNSSSSSTTATPTTSSTSATINGSNELKPPEFFEQMNEILRDKINTSLLFADNDDGSGNTTNPTGSDEDDEFYMKKRRKLCDPDVVTNSDERLTDVQFERLFALFEERTKLMRERNQQTDRLLNLFERLIEKFE